MTNSHSGYHDAVGLTDNFGQVFFVDYGVVDLVIWLSGFPGVTTFTSCQGGGCTEKAFVGFRCDNAHSLSDIAARLSSAEITRSGDSYRIDICTSDLISLNESMFPESDMWKVAFFPSDEVLLRVESLLEITFPEDRFPSGRRPS